MRPYPCACGCGKLLNVETAKGLAQTALVVVDGASFYLHAEVIPSIVADLLIAAEKVAS